ncbi:unnamed protein product [Moneuplotes crassus]|uniref:non-specific serine/threonine protein kinase n=1 Tax=Euplotes crassus TaxID=5936 RepID=A0AAD1Y501_EUPCR|nr:unnamed protein product [Moneuplotes crassus]
MECICTPKDGMQGQDSDLVGNVRGLSTRITFTTERDINDEEESGPQFYYAPHAKANQGEEDYKYPSGDRKNSAGALKESDDKEIYSYDQSSRLIKNAKSTLPSDIKEYACRNYTERGITAKPNYESSTSNHKLRVKDFEFLGLLGEGAFGRVFHVVRKSDGEQFALKAIRKMDCKNIKERIHRERALMTDINHVGIIKLYSTFQDSKNLYFLLELASNGELYTYMKNEEILQYKQAKFLAAEILSMIEYLKDQKISHRDLKPSNLLFDSRMRLKLADFGSAKSFLDQEVQSDEVQNRQSGGSPTKRSIRRMNTFVGTVEYMAPEIIQGTCTMNSCDLWSFGIIIYKFFAESSPFQGEFDEDTIRKIEEEDPIFPENFPEMAKDLCERLLEKDPLKRIGCGKEGTELDMFSLKAHPFFDGIDFEYLEFSESPIPIPTVLLSSTKSKIIEKCRNSAPVKSEKASSTITEPTDFTSACGKSRVHNLDNCKTLEDFYQNSIAKNIRVLFKGPLKYRSRMLITYNSATALFTDEPALYLYSQNKGLLKARYNIPSYVFTQKGSNRSFSENGKNICRSNKFNLKQIKVGGSDFEKDTQDATVEDTSYKPCKFKMCTRKVSDETIDSPSDLVFLLNKYCAKE